jgi:hypothetical protein
MDISLVQTISAAASLTFLGKSRANLHIISISGLPEIRSCKRANST